MTVAINNIVRSVAPKSIFESAKTVIDATVSYNQGDLIAFDGSANLLKAVTAYGDAVGFLGVAKQTIVLGVVKSPYTGTAVDAAQAVEDIAGPVYGVVASLILKTADAFNPGDKVYLTSNAQTISSVNPGSGDTPATDNYIGIYQGKVVASATAGQKGDILLGTRIAGVLNF